MQLGLDFSGKMPPAVQVKVREGMARADANADPRWRHIFDGCVLAAARRLAELTADDVLEEVEKLPAAPATHNLSAIGPAMKRAAKMGILGRTERLVRSLRAEKHGNLHYIWTSNYYRKEGEDNAKQKA